MGTTVIILMLVLNCIFIASAFTSMELHDANVKFKNDCVTNGRIICDEGLVLVGVCLTRASHLSNLTVYGLCPYIIVTDQEIYQRWTIDGLFQQYYHINFTMPEQTCGKLNRKGLLCSQCNDGYGPSVCAFASECVKCRGSAFSRWVLHLFVVLFPITMFYVIVIIFNIQATSPPFAAYVLFCQTFTALDRIYFCSSTKASIHDPSQVLLLLARTLSGIWNLDFGRYIFPPFCVSDSINSYHSLFLDYIPGFYLMVLIVTTYCLIELHSSNFMPVVLLWKPFHKCFVRVRRSWDPKASMINTFATFYFFHSPKYCFYLVLHYSVNTYRQLMAIFIDYKLSFTILILILTAMKIYLLLCLVFLSRPYSSSYQQ